MSANQPRQDKAPTEWPPGWEHHELDQLRRMAKLTLAEKLEWLEEAHALVLRLARARATSQPTPQEPGP
ncbi:MAG: hypothetical protein IV100_11650 [Myxococcales bacterium]|nr:hypothetical protein [Myxococcales bacterium]